MSINRAARRQQLYGICGLKGHGKDTFARMVLEASKESFSINHFADALKLMASQIFGLTDAQMNDPLQKEADLPSPITMDVFVESMSDLTGLTIKPLGNDFVARSPRQAMQYFGTNYVRGAQDDYWLKRLLAGAVTKYRVLIPDCRFINEAEAIRSVGGLIIKIVRIDAPVASDLHPSETEMNAIEPDLLIGVRTGNLSLPARIAKLVASNKFDAAMKYDYRRVLEAIRAYSSGTSAELSTHFLGQGHKDPQTLYNVLHYYGIPRRSPDNRKSHELVDGVPCKECGDCHQLQPLAFYNAHARNWDGLHSVCRSCASVRNRDAYKKYGTIDSLERIFKNSKRQAKMKKREFTLSFEDIKEILRKQNGKCVYSGEVLTTKPGSPSKLSIDRVDSSKGYTKDNVVLCGVRVNIMKRSMSVSEFAEIVQKLHNKLPWSF